MTQANIYEAKTQLSKLIQKAIDGEEVVIAKSGKPLVKLVLVDSDRSSIIFGLMEGQIEIADDFNEFGPELSEMFGIED